MFLLKKIIAPIFSPLPVCIELLLLGFLFLYSPSRQRLGKFLIGSSLVLMLVFSNTFIANQLLQSLENDHKPLKMNSAPNVKWVVVLGGGNSGDRTYPATTRISQSAMMRLIEGIRIHKLVSGSKLVLSGGSVFGSLPDAVVMAQVAESIGIGREEMIVESRARDTEEEAQALQPILKDESFILVTSASHLPRSVSLFRKYGMRPIPAPTDFLVKSENTISPARIYPNAGALGKTEKAFHEYLGMVWGKL